MWFLQWLDQTIRWIEDSWPIKLLYILSAAATVAVVVVAPFYVWLKTRSPLPRRKKSEPKPLYLGVQHCESPDRYKLDGKLVGVTGIILYLDEKAGTLELYGFPFAVRSRVTCELAADEKTKVEALQLVFVVGTAVGNAHPDDNSRCLLHLKDCHIRRPSFANRVRHWLINGPIGGPLREWYYLGG